MICVLKKSGKRTQKNPISLDISTEKIFHFLQDFATHIVMCYLANNELTKCKGVKRRKAKAVLKDCECALLFFPPFVETIR